MLTLRRHDDRERRSDRFSFLGMLQLCAAVLLFTVLAMSQANAQTAVVTAGSPNTSPGSGTVTYSASVAITNPALTSEQQITNVTYAWGSSDTCNPTTSSSTTVTAQRSSPGASSSSVGCTVTWYIYNTYTKQTTTASASGGASVSFKLGVLWAKGTITGGIITSPQNQTNTPYSPTTVITSPSSQLTCTVSAATATDTSTFTYGSTTTHGSGTDTVSYAWTASAGTLANASSASTTWTAPNTPQSGPITLTCTISATAPAVVSPDGGQRGPSSISATVQVYIPTITLTVSGGGVTQSGVTGANNWAAVMSFSGNVTVTAAVTPYTPDIEAAISWSGGTAVSGNNLQRTVPLTSSAQTPVTASIAGSSATADIWVIWGSISILAANGQSDPQGGLTPNSAYFSSVTDHTIYLGPRSGTDPQAPYPPDAWLKYVAVCQVTPSGVHSIISSGFTMNRTQDSVTWKDGSPWGGSDFNTGGSYIDDTSYANLTSLVPDANDSIYDDDAPNAEQEGATSKWETYTNFKELAKWNGTQITGTVGFYMSGVWVASNPSVFEIGYQSGIQTLPTTP